MQLITFNDPHRQKHFEFFNAMDQPHFSLTANVDISTLLPYLKEQGISFTPAIVYLITRTGNEIPAFRWRIRGEAVVEHAYAHPSFTVLTEVSDVFSFCYVEYAPDAMDFVSRAKAAIQRMQVEPEMEDDPDRDDYFFLSSIPWVSFTNIQHAMHYSPADSVPRITWGRYFRQGDQVLMPLSVQAHHAVVDGQDVGRYFNRIQELMNDPSPVFRRKM